MQQPEIVSSQVTILKYMCTRDSSITRMTTGEQAESRKAIIHNSINNLFSFDVLRITQIKNMFIENNGHLELYHIPFTRYWNCVLSKCKYLK